jgi:hypothetical protein
VRNLATRIWQVMLRVGHRTARPSIAGAIAVLLVAGMPDRAQGQEQDVARHMALIQEKAGELMSLVREERAGVLADGHRSQLEQAYNRYGYLLTAAKIDEVLQSAEQAPDSVTRREWLRTADILRLLAARYNVAEMTDAFADAMVNRGVEVEGREVHLRDLQRRITLEPDRDMRRKLWLAGGELYALARVYQRNLMLQLDRSARKFGAAGYYPLLAAVEGWDLDRIEELAQLVLTATQPAYDQGLADLAGQALGLEQRQLRTFDVARLVVLPHLAASVGGKKPLGIVKRTAKDLGLDLGGQRTLKIDVGDKDNRLPEARAYPLSPGRGLITMVPGSTLTDVPDLLGAVGAAEFGFLMPKDLAFDATYVGTNIYPSTYRALLEMIAEEPDWIERNLSPDSVERGEISRALALRRLYQVRLAAAKFLFQRRLQADPAIDPSTYTDMMEQVLGCDLFQNDEQGYFFANDDFRSGGLFLGYVIAAQVREVLRTRWGGDWYRHQELAQRLAEGSREGYGMPLDRFLAVWGVESLDAQPLVGEFSEAPIGLSAGQATEAGQGN